MDEPLRALEASHDVRRLREQFFMVHGEAYWSFVLELSPKALETVNVQFNPTSAQAPAPDDETLSLTAEDQSMYQSIRRWRRARAEQLGIPPFAILSNRELTALILRRPSTKQELMSIPGLGQKKVARFGDDLLELLRGGSVELTANHESENSKTT